MIFNDNSNGFLVNVKRMHPRSMENNNAISDSLLYYSSIGWSFYGNFS
ncbi:MAG: hypothetical protein LBB21_00550 [Holosporaceae bacterium]|nr:hypothetical protein [Holosporaceae bacterium]